jgi:hypothetical protein
MWSSGLYAQQDTTRAQSSQDTAKVEQSVPDTTAKRPAMVPGQQGQELVLEEIYIEPVIEKPNVSIVPSRQAPDFGEVELVKRSFARELKSVPKKIMILDEELESARRVQKIKKILAKKKK